MAMLNNQMVHLGKYVINDFMQIHVDDKLLKSDLSMLRRKHCGGRAHRCYTALEDVGRF
jgi:hypothetical protein